MSVFLQTVGNDIDLLLERDHFRIFRQSAHDLLMTHESVSTKMHQFSLSVVGIR